MPIVGALVSRVYQPVAGSPEKPGTKNVSYKLCYMRGKTGKINLGLIELRIDFFFSVAKWRFFGWWCLFCLIIIIVVLDTFHSLGPTVIYVYSYQSAFYSCDRMPRINTFE